MPARFKIVALHYNTCGPGKTERMQHSFPPGAAIPHQQEHSVAEPTRILFVCLGNIVRSPLAEKLFAQLAAQSGRGADFFVDSAGIGGWHVGEAPDARMRQVAARRGFHYSGSARQFSPQDFDRFDWVIAMDAENRRDLLRQAQSSERAARVRLLREFDPQGGPSADVPDPYYGGLEGFEQVYDMIARSCAGLLAALEDEQV